MQQLRLIKRKTQEKFFQEATASSRETQWHNIKSTWEHTKTNLKDRQSLTSGSTQVMIASQHTFIAAKYPAITAAQYANRKTQ